MLDRVMVAVLTLGALAIPPAALAQDGTAELVGDTTDAAVQRNRQFLCTAGIDDADEEAAALREASGARGTLIVNCAGRAIVFGEVDGFVAVPHQATGALAVYVIRGDDRRLWLLTPRPNGGILREDLTGELARASGRSVTSGIDDIRIDLSAFRQAGTVGLIPQERAGARSARAATLALEPRLNARARAANLEVVE